MLHGEKKKNCLVKTLKTQVWWIIPIISELGRLSQEDHHKCKASLCCTVSAGLALALKSVSKKKKGNPTFKTVDSS